MPLKPFRAVLAAICIAAAFVGSASSAEDLNVYFKSYPPTELLRPFADAADFSLLVTGADGRPIEHGTVAIQLEAPPPAAFSTDYPLVEGTVLNEMELPLRAGRAQWKQLLPIRGDYRLRTAISAGNQKINKDFNVHVRENWHKWVSLGLFSVMLFLLGFTAGRVFTRLPGTGFFIVALIVVLVALGVPARAENSASLEVDGAVVGQASEIRWRLAGENGGATASARLTLRISHLEKSKIVFAVERIATSAAWSMHFHFPDAGAYRIDTIAAVPAGPALTNEKLVQVAGVEPPVSASVPALGYFIGLIGAGLGVGRWSKRAVLRSRPNSLT